MTRFSAIYIDAGTVHRMTFEATDINAAKVQAEKWGVGVDGEAPGTEESAPPQAEAYDLATARRILGNVSRATVYRWLLLGELKRVAGTRKVLITRESIERRAGRNP
jgi:hypothetical protein